MNKNAADRISETDGFWDLEEMLPVKRTPRRFSSDTGTAEVSLGNDKEKEMSEPIPKRPVTGKTAAALDTARKALSDIESRLKTVSAAASHDRKTAYDEWKASRDTLSDGAENAGGVICGMLDGKNFKDALEYGVAASALKHTIPGDFNLVSRKEVETLAGGDASGRVQR